MSHNCKALILHCIDFHFGKAIKKYLEDNQLLGDCDIVSVAGATQNIAAPKSETDREFILRQIDISKQLHNIGKIILMNHTDCGAYGGRKAFSSDEEEKRRHASDMKTAKKIILEKYPDLRVKIILTKINDVHEITFEEIVDSRNK